MTHESVYGMIEKLDRKFMEKLQIAVNEADDMDQELSQRIKKLDEKIDHLRKQGDQNARRITGMDFKIRDLAPEDQK